MKIPGKMPENSFFSKEDISTIDEIVSFLKKGFSKEKLMKTISKKNLSKEGFEELVEIAKGRIKAKEKFSKPEKWFLNSEDLRFATPEIVAGYRAERLKCSVIADICCGIGSQSIAFARNCRKVYAIDNDERKIRYAKMNAESFGIKNITFICADIFDETTISKIKDADIIFCDPERAAEEEERSIERIPFVKWLLEKYSIITKNMAFEIPPQLGPEKIDFNCEKEYLSLNNKLNRLTLYFGDLKQCDRSALLLPGKERLCSNEKLANKSLVDESADEEKNLESNNKTISEISNKLKKFEALDYLYEVNPAVVKAGLVEQLLNQNGISDKLMLYSKNSIKKILLLTSKQNIENNFLKKYLVVGKSKPDIKSISDALKRVNAKSVVLRAAINPSEYWRIRNEIEKELSGDEKIHLFVFDEEAVLCK